VSTLSQLWEIGLRLCGCDVKCCVQNVSLTAHVERLCTCVKCRQWCIEPLPPSQCNLVLLLRWNYVHHDHWGVIAACDLLVGVLKVGAKIALASSTLTKIITFTPYYVLINQAKVGHASFAFYSDLILYWHIFQSLLFSDLCGSHPLVTP